MSNANSSQQLVPLKRYATKPKVASVRERANNTGNNHNQQGILEDNSDEEEEIKAGIEFRKVSVQPNQTKLKELKNNRNFNAENISSETIDAMTKKYNEEKEENVLKGEYRMQKQSGSHLLETHELEKNNSKILFSAHYNNLIYQKR